MKSSRRRTLRLALGRLRRFNRGLKGEDAGVASRHLRSTLLRPTRAHLTRLDRFVIFMSNSPLPLLILVLAVGSIGEAIDSYKDVLPAHVQFMALSALVLLALFHRSVRSLAQPNRRKILLLRRFHTERLPAYPLSRVMHRLVERGYQVVTLRDSIVDGDRETLGGIAELVTLALVLVIALGFVGAAFGLLLLFLKLDGTQAFAAIKSPAVRGAFFVVQGTTAILCLLSLWSKKGVIRGLMRRTLDRCQARVAERFIRLADTLERDHVAFRHRGQLSMRIVKADDETWLRDVQALMDACDVVVVDLSNPSENVRLEVIELGRRQGRCVPIWLRAANQPSLVRQHDGGYDVLGVSFSGDPIEATYPSRRATRKDYQIGTNAGLNPWEYLAAATLASTIESAVAHTRGQEPARMERLAA